jgi:predicted nucleotidyltransferase
MLLHEVLLRTLSDLEDLGFQAALLGGLAVSAWTDPRFTRDVDLAVAVSSDAEAEQLIHKLQQRGYRLKALVEQTGTERLATARLIPPGEEEEGVIVDLLFASSGIEPEIVAGAAVIDIGAGAPVKVVRPGDLVVLKLLANDRMKRPQDGADLVALRGVLDAAELERAREGCALVQRRGFHRGRDLGALLEELLGHDT